METVLASPSFPLKKGEGGRSLTLVPSPEERDDEKIIQEIMLKNLTSFSPEEKKIELKNLHIKDEKDKLMGGCAAQTEIIFAIF